MELELVRAPEDLRTALAQARQQGQSVGLVPTMGYLHGGHAELIRRSAAENDLTVVSVFVNPTQFAPTDDLEAYPRDLDRDREVAASAEAGLLFFPDAAQMYLAGHATTVQVAGLSTRVEGASRPGHFDGVATVVLMLLNLAQPQRAYFGEKDWQQLAVVRRMVRDLWVPTEIVGVPTVRAQSGLALSSRNSYLTDEGRTQAATVSQALRAMQAAYQGGQRDAGALRQAGLAVLAQQPVQLDYLLLLDGDLQTLKGALTPAQAAQARLVFAGRLHGVRLIDNLPLVSAY